MISPFQYQFQQIERDQLLMTNKVRVQYKEIDSGSWVALMLCLFGVEQRGWGCGELDFQENEVSGKPRVGIYST